MTPIQKTKYIAVISGQIGMSSWIEAGVLRVDA
jgi:hypothetical protein